MTKPITVVVPLFGADAVQTPRPTKTAVDAQTGVQDASTVGKAADPPKPAAADPTPAASPTKLIVERSKDLPTFIYKIVDRTSGEVLAEFPREAAQSLAQAPNYTAGDVVDETA